MESKPTDSACWAAATILVELSSSDDKKYP